MTDEFFVRDKTICRKVPLAEVMALSDKPWSKKLIKSSRAYAISGSLTVTDSY